MHDLLSGQAREIVRTVWDGKQPTALAFLYANSARLLGFVAGDNSNEIILGPVLAVGSAAGTVTLLNLGTLQVCGKCNKRVAIFVHWNSQMMTQARVRRPARAPLRCVSP
jgi:hypothetical protein